jgi:phosphopantetheinyl transferase
MRAAPAQAVAQGWRLNSGTGLHLSLSDTGTCYVAGIARSIPMGIDAEAVRPVPDGLQTLRRLGLLDLVGVLERLPAAARNRAFLEIWTAFESFLKLERLAWEAGAARFAALQRHWIIGTQGRTRFQGHHAGVHFQHVEAGKLLVVGIATPVQATIEIKRITLPLRSRRSPGISSAAARR